MIAWWIIAKLKRKTILLKPKKWLSSKEERLKVRPESAPILKGKCAKLFTQKLAEPLTAKQLSIYAEADRVFKAIKPRK